MKKVLIIFGQENEAHLISTINEDVAENCIFTRDQLRKKMENLSKEQLLEKIESLFFEVKK